MSDNVKLITMDGEEVEVDKEIACKSVLVRGIIDDNDEDEAIHLPSVKKATLDKIIEYCTYISQHPPPEIEKPLRSSNLQDCVNEWYANFVNLEQKDLIELLMAAHFMDIKSLMELIGAKIVSKIKGKSIKEIR